MNSLEQTDQMQLVKDYYKKLRATESTKERFKLLVDDLALKQFNGKGNLKGHFVIDVQYAEWENFLDDLYHLGYMNSFEGNYEFACTEAKEHLAIQLKNAISPDRPVTFRLTLPRPFGVGYTVYKQAGLWTLDKCK